MEATKCCLSVGGGRGFVIAGERDRFIITAAHCLPFLPPCTSFSYIEERTYKSLIGLLGKEQTIWAECLFADPIGDIAVLGAPDSQHLSAEYRSFQEMIEAAVPVYVSEAPLEGVGWLLSLDQRWFQCKINRQPGGTLWISDATENLVSGMSGSPIMASGGKVIGVHVCGWGEVSTEGGPNPAPVRNFPGWLLRELASQTANNSDRSL
jgi:hypothetical protein